MYVVSNIKVSLYSDSCTKILPCMDIPGQYLDNPVSIHLHVKLAVLLYTPKLPWTSLQYPRMTHCQYTSMSKSKVTLDIHRLSEDALLPMHLHVKVSVYTKVTLDIHGLSKDDLLPIHLPVKVSVYTSYIGNSRAFQGCPTANAPPCRSIRVHQSYIGHPQPFRGCPTANAPTCQSICVHQGYMYIGHPRTFRGWPIANAPPCQSILVHQSYMYIGHSKDALLPMHLPAKVSMYTKATLDIHGLSSMGYPLQYTPLSKYLCAPKLHWTFTDFPRMPYCQCTFLSKYTCTPNRVAFTN